MALVHPFRADGGSGDIVVGTWFVSLIYVLPERWGTGIGGFLLDAVFEEAKRRGGHHICLWTHEYQNERAHRLYRSRSFAPTGRTMQDGEGHPIGEWCSDCE
jgi:GNAT superfamily N-acetyltransferase